MGTGYHWYILVHQNVTKLNANDYSTLLTGMTGKKAVAQKPARVPTGMPARGRTRRTG